MEGMSVVFSRKRLIFFSHFFSNPVRCNKEVVVRKRGAWVRIYGVPLHAWIPDFFKLCVYDCGRLLQVDEFTMDKIRFDYARVLLSTSSMDIIITGAKVMVDGELFDFQIIEEWGFALGEDACLCDVDEAQGDAEPPPDSVHDGGVASGEVDVLMNQLSADWQNEDIVVPVRNSEGIFNVETEKMPIVEKAATLVPQDVSLSKQILTADTVTVQPAVQATTSAMQDGSLSKQIHSSATVTVQQAMQKTQEHAAACRGVSKSCLLPNGVKRPNKRTSSCPPGRAHSTSAGPWSLE